MEEIINQSAISHLFQLFVLTTALVVFWFLESALRLDKRWLIPILIFPPSLFLFIFVYWEESRAKCFFASLLLFVMILVGGLVGNSFYAQILAFFKVVAFWPYYFYEYVLHHIHI